MSVEVWDSKLEETFITKVTVINPSTQSVPIPSKYRVLFRGLSSVPYGRHSFRFPITHMGYKRLVSSFQTDFARELKINFGGSDFDEV